MKHLLPVTILALAMTIGVAKADVITMLDLTAGAVSTVDTTSTGSIALAEAILSVNLSANASTSTGSPASTDLAESIVNLNLLATASTATGSTAFVEAIVNLELLAIASTSTNLLPVSITPVIAAVPEPPSLALFAGVVSMLGLGLVVQRIKQTVQGSDGVEPELPRRIGPAEGLDPACARGHKH
jgi:hypothetical protein